jgi:hypothetical protein
MSNCGPGSVTVGQAEANGAGPWPRRERAPRAGDVVDGGRPALEALISPGNRTRLLTAATNDYSEGRGSCQGAPDATILRQLKVTSRVEQGGNAVHVLRWDGTHYGAKPSVTPPVWTT